LRASLTELGSWARITARVGDGQTRSCAQVKSTVKTLHANLRRIGITLQHPDEVDCLPDVFFDRPITNGDEADIRQHFLEARLAVLRAGGYLNRMT
jgi:hypothetical protein